MNQLNMQNDENAVIRYLMKEMDPSEEVLMERAMMEDDDLLIEVESMRQTLHRLDDLPDKSPPEEVTESIIKQAAEQKKRKVQWPSIPSQALKYAAVLLVGMGLGSGVWMFMDSSPANDTVSDSAAISLNLQEASQLNSDVEPWVDRENVIYYQDMFNRQSSDFNAILETSMNKLTPVTQPFNTGSGARNVQLTGSKN
jgi:hypothetical protein